MGKYTAVFKGYTLTKDDEGNDAMVLTYDYTNGSKDEQSFAWAFMFEATQAGEALGSPMYDGNNNQITKNYEEKVKKGQTLEVAIALTLVNTTNDVIIVFSDFDDHEYTQTIKLSGSGVQDSGPEEAGSYQLYEMTFLPLRSAATTAPSCCERRIKTRMNSFCARNGDRWNNLE